MEAGLFQEIQGLSRMAVGETEAKVFRGYIEAEGNAGC